MFNSDIYMSSDATCGLEDGHKSVQSNVQNKIEFTLVLQYR